MYLGAQHLGAYARSAVGFEKAEGHAWIERLMNFASNPDFVYAHRWRQGDLVAWDNRVVMPRATLFARTTEHQNMVRNTASCLPIPH